MKIVFWGTPKYAAENLLGIINSDHEVIAVVTQPDRKRSRGNNLSPSPVKQIAIDFGIPVYTTPSIRKDEQTKKILFNLNADVYIVVAFGQILPIEILEKPKHGCWNSHASLLPIWRGAAPIHWSILNDDAKTGVCIMSMEAGLDTGPVIEKETIDINDKDNLDILTNRLSKISTKLLVKSLDKIKDTIGLNHSQRLKYLNAIDQSELDGNPSYARQIKKEDYIINWNLNSRNIFKKVQGLYPNAYTIHNGKRIKISKVDILSSEDCSDYKINIDDRIKESFQPGQVINIDKENGILINTADHYIIIKSAQLEGKKRTDAYTLAIQCKIEHATILGI